MQIKYVGHSCFKISDVARSNQASLMELRSWLN